MPRKVAEIYQVPKNIRRTPAITAIADIIILGLKDSNSRLMRKESGKLTMPLVPVIRGATMLMGLVLRAVYLNACAIEIDTPPIIIGIREARLSRRNFSLFVG